MRNIADIIKDDRNGKQLSQTERQIAVAYIQGKYDAVMELKISNNSNINKVIDKIRAEIKALCPEPTAEDVVDGDPIKDAVWETLADALQIIDKYKIETEET